MASKKKVEAGEALEKEQAAGAFAGSEGFVDKTPNENYSVAGVTAGKPTPETMDKGRAPLREAQPGLPAAHAPLKEKLSAGEEQDRADETEAMEAGEAADAAGKE